MFENIKAKITVLNSTIENAYPEVMAKQNILLDLNGKDILLNDSYTGIKNNGTLQIIDFIDLFSLSIDNLSFLSEI